MITLRYPFPAAEKTEKLELIAAACRRGEVIIYPTETFYALGGNALDEELGRRLSQIKNRSDDKPFPTLVGNSTSLKKLVADLSETARQLADKYWPGALTMVLSGLQNLPEAITGGKNSIAVRWSSHPLINDLAKITDLPLISTSANLSTQPPVQKAADLSPAILAATDLLVIADNDNPKPLPSTIVDARLDPPLILRPGAVTIT
jgi:L-threonylcarbamoyladenylate synthase